MEVKNANLPLGTLTCRSVQEFSRRTATRKQEHGGETRRRTDKGFNMLKVNVNLQRREAMEELQVPVPQHHHSSK